MVDSRGSFAQRGTMGKQLTPKERDEARRLAWERKAPFEIWKKSKARRVKRRKAPPKLTMARRFFKGKMHAGAAVETRGCQRKFRAGPRVDKVHKG